MLRLKFGTARTVGGQEDAEADGGEAEVEVNQAADVDLKRRRKKR